MQRPDILAISAKWIAELRLQDRLITIRYTTNLSDPFGNLVYGLMTIENLDEGRFLIEVQDPDTWPAVGSRELSAQAIEECVVHELVHIRWIDVTAYNPNPASIVQEERATWSTTQALVRANPSQRAAMVRAMAAQRAATRRQTKGRSMAMDPETAKMLLDALDSNADPSAAVAAVRKVVESALTGGQETAPSVQDPNAPPMGADVGNDPQNDKPPMGDQNMMRAMQADLKSIRSMRVEIEAYRNEAKAAADIVRPEAKKELVRAMRAEGFEMTTDAEKRILEAPTVEIAKDRAESMRAMAPAGTRKPNALSPNGGAAGLMRAQSLTYNKMLSNGNEKGAETYRAECVRLNEAQKGGAK